MESPEPPTGTELSPAQQAVGKQATVQLGTTTETKESKSTASGLYDYLQKAFSPGQGPSGGETPQGSHSPNPEMPQLEEGRGDATLQTGDQGDTDACLTPRSLAGSDTPAGCRSPKPALPEAEVQLLRVNFMLCGRAGLGKTTCLRNMFEDYLEGVGGTPDAPLGDDVLAASSEGLGDRLVRMLVSTPPVPLDNDRRQIVYRIQDTPGYSEALPFAGQPEIAAAVDEMVAHVRSLKVKEWQEWNGAVAPRGLVEYQTMLDACLYFLPPHRLSTCDLQFLQKLSKEVPVILVIAKADSMTTAETLQYKREIMEIVKQPNTSALASAAGNGQPPQPIPIFSFDAEAANLGGVHFGPMPPFAIVCSPTVGPRGPERAFGWGTCYCWEPEHSDLVHLREMLLGSSGFRSLRAAKHECYSEYVEERSAADQASQQARTLAEKCAVQTISGRDAAGQAQAAASAAKQCGGSKQAAEEAASAAEGALDAAQKAEQASAAAAAAAEQACAHASEGLLLDLAKAEAAEGERHANAVGKHVAVAVALAEDAVAAQRRAEEAAAEIAAAAKRQAEEAEVQRRAAQSKCCIIC